MTFEQVIFYFFAAILVGSAAGVVMLRNSVHAVLFLVLAFFSSAGLWILLEAEFLAIVLVLVYVGAVMVLFMFVVMMLDINKTQMRDGLGRHLPVGALVAFLIALQMSVVLGANHFGIEVFPLPERVGADYSNTRELGMLLYTVYAYPFELAGAILLVAIVAAIALTLRHRGGSRKSTPQWANIRREDRVRLVDMPSEIRAGEGVGSAVVENEVVR